MSEPRHFDLGDILTITSDVLVSPRGANGAYDILNFMTGESLFTHQLPRVAAEAKPVLLRQHPQLADVDASSVNKENWHSWLTEQKARYGYTLPVTPMSEDEHEYRDPLSEAAEHFPPDKIIVVDVGEGK